MKSAGKPRIFYMRKSSNFVEKNTLYDFIISKIFGDYKIAFFA